MEFAQFRPGENDAVPVNNQVVQSHRSEIKFVGRSVAWRPILISEWRPLAFSLLRGAPRVEPFLPAFSTTPACDQDMRDAASVSF